MIEEEPSSTKCLHTVIFDRICSECGAIVVPDKRYRKNNDIYVLSTEKKESSIEKLLYDRKKLSLIVDLDKTLIDTMRFLNEQEANKIITIDNKNESEYMYFKTNEPFLIRFRPFVNEFLEKISPYYYMQLYTLSERSYALPIIQKIDPKGKYFNNRIIAREDNNSIYKKSISALNGQNMTVIIDDTRHVWSKSNGKVEKNLVQVKPYNFFPKIQKPKHVKSAIDFISQNFNRMDICDDYLKQLANVLIELHSRFYNFGLRNVSSIINEIKLSVFKGCYIYFCSIWAEDNIQQKNLYVNDAKNFGAKVLKKFVPYVTHIVTTNPTHNDVIEAQNYKGIFIVNHKWFVDSIFKFKKQHELNKYYSVTNHSGVAPLITSGPDERKEPPNIESNSDLED